MIVVGVVMLLVGSGVGYAFHMGKARSATHEVFANPIYEDANTGEAANRSIINVGGFEGTGVSTGVYDDDGPYSTL